MVRVVVVRTVQPILTTDNKISVSRLKKKNCKYEYENFSYLEKNEI